MVVEEKKQGACRDRHHYLAVPKHSHQLYMLTFHVKQTVYTCSIRSQKRSVLIVQPHSLMSTIKNRKKEKRDCQENFPYVQDRRQPGQPEKS